MDHFQLEGLKRGFMPNSLRLYKYRPVLITTKIFCFFIQTKMASNTVLTFIGNKI